MGFLSGSTAFVRFGVDGELPVETETHIARRIAAYSFKDIDETTDEYSIGWVSVANMFDASFSYAGHRFGDYLALTLRIDERKISPAAMKKCVAREEERLKKERQVPRIGKRERAEIKERLHRQLTARAIPVPSLYDLCWNLSENSILFFSTNRKVHAVLEDFFKECFGLRLVLKIPFTLAEQMLDEDGVTVLHAISPQIFV